MCCICSLHLTSSRCSCASAADMVMCHGCCWMSLGVIEEDWGCECRYLPLPCSLWWSWEVTCTGDTGERSSLTWEEGGGHWLSGEVGWWWWFSLEAALTLNLPSCQCCVTWPHSIQVPSPLPVYRGYVWPPDLYITISLLYTVYLLCICGSFLTEFNILSLPHGCSLYFAVYFPCALSISSIISFI